MSAAKNPIKILVIDEDDAPIASEARLKQKKKQASQVKALKATNLTAGKTKTANSKVSPEVDAEKIKAVKKRLVTEAIENLDEDDEIKFGARSLNSENSFVEKLKKELNESERGTVKSNKIAVLDEELFSVSANSSSQNQSALNTAKGSRANDETIQEIVKTKERTNRSVNIYRRIAYFFVFLVIVLAVASAYLLLTKVTIVLIPDQERMSNNLIFDVIDTDSTDSTSKDKVKGIVKTITIDHKKSYPATGEEVIGKEAVGKVMLVNSYTKNQMLVATTRLIAASGELFRLKNTVNIPAGGEAEAEIYADDPSPEMALEPTKFSIPGLWAGLQDKIYAESKEKISYQQKIKKHITQDDLDNGARDIRQQLLVKAKTEVNKSYSNFDEIIYNLDDATVKTEMDAEPGAELDEVNISISADVIVVAFDGKEAALLAQQKFVSALPSDKEQISFADEEILYSLNNYNRPEGSATINASFEGKVSIKENSNIIDKSKIKNLNKKQLEVYLKDIKGVSGFDIKFYPSFLPEFLKKVPRMPDRIEIEVKK